MKLRALQGGGWAFFCPGCDHAHVFFTTWQFNGNQTCPTFTPSLKNTCPDHVDPKQRCCHLNLSAGKLIYHGDCTHDLKGKTIDLPDWPYGGEWKG